MCGRFTLPLSVEPLLCEQKVAQRLLERTMELFGGWGYHHTCLFTFSHSPNHAVLYQKFDFSPRFLPPVMLKQLAAKAPQHRYALFCDRSTDQKQGALAGCRETAGAIYEGLDISREILAVDSQRLGDTILSLDGSNVSAFGVCHVGPKTEQASTV
jgi:hypothetical protein